MTDTPGWAPPGSPEPPNEAAGSSAPPPPATVPQDAPPSPHIGAQGWSTPGPYDSTAYGAPQPHPGQRHPVQPYPGQPYPGPQYPGAQFPGWGAPPSPKPGVIPLRPLGVGEILDGATSTVRKHWRTALGLSFGIAAVEQTLNALTQLWEYERPHDVLPLVVQLTAGYPVAILLSLVATGLLTIVVSKAVIGENVTLGTAWASARPRLAKLAGLTLLTMAIGAGIVLVAGLPLIGVAIGGASMSPLTIVLVALPLLASLPVVLWVGVQLSLAAPALMLEKQGIRASLARSRRLVKGSWWRIFGITLLGEILVAIVAGIIALPFVAIGAVLTFGDTPTHPAFGGLATGAPPIVVLTVAVGGILAGTLTIPVLAAINVLIYVDQRIRREALDIELARAAGLPEYGKDNPGWSGPGPVVPGQSGPQGA